MVRIKTTLRVYTLGERSNIFKEIVKKKKKNLLLLKISLGVNFLKL